MKDKIQAEVNKLSVSYQNMPEKIQMYELIKRISEDKPINAKRSQDTIIQYVMGVEKLLQQSFKLTALTAINNEAINRVGLIAMVDRAIYNAKKAHEELG